MKKSLIDNIKTPTLRRAEEILKAAGTEVDLFDEIEKAKHQDGDMHPNGKWVWVSSAAGGKGDWRKAGGRTHTKHQAANAGGAAPSKTVEPKPQATSAPKAKTTTAASPQLKTTSAESKKKQPTTSKGKFAQSVLDAYQYRQPSGSSLNLEDFITDTVKKGGLYYVKIDYHKMTPRQKKEFDAVADKLKNAGWRVEDNGGFGKIIGEPTPSDTTKTKTPQKKLRPVGAGTLGPERRTPEAQERIDKKRKEKVDINNFKQSHITSAAVGSVIIVNKYGRNTKMTKTSSSDWEYIFDGKTTNLNNEQIFNKIEHFIDRDYFVNFDELK